jgi:hypothetical protein
LFEPLFSPIPSNSLNLSPKAMFIFEYQTRLISGFVRWSDPVRIRHVATGRYLYVDTTPFSIAPTTSRGAFPPARDKDNSTFHRTALMDDDGTHPISIARTLFHIVPTDEQGEYVPEAQVRFRYSRNRSLQSVVSALDR